MKALEINDMQLLHGGDSCRTASKLGRWLGVTAAVVGLAALTVGTGGVAVGALAAGAITGTAGSLAITTLTFNTALIIGC